MNLVVILYVQAVAGVIPVAVEINMNRIHNNQLQRGFSLIELLIYIALVSIFVSGFVMFGWDLILSSVKSQVFQEVDFNLMSVNQKITYYLRQAKSVYAIGTDYICVEIDDANFNPLGFYNNSGVLEMRWGGGDTSCSTFSNTENIISNQVEVVGFNVQDLSNGNSNHIGYDLDIKHLNPGGRTERDYQNNISSSVELRN